MDNKAKIIAGAKTMFTKYGIRSITMDMIAEQLGMSKRTIYETFKDKDELLIACIESGKMEQRKISEDIMKNSENVIEAMIKIVKHNVNMLKTINPLFIRDIKKYYHEIDKHTLEHSNKEILTEIVGLLNRGIQEKLFRNNINVEIVAILLNEQFKMLSDHDVFPEEKFSKAEVFENIVINFMRGIATTEGLSLIDKYNF